MSEKIRIGEMFVPILPKKYRYQENYVHCDDVLCSEYGIDCKICPFIFHKVEEKKIDIIECNQKLIEVNLWGDYWGVSELSLNEIKKYGIGCCNISYCNSANGIGCSFCRFNDRKTYSLDELKYRELD